MSEKFPLAPRYRLDDEQPWLIGVDPLRRYWLSVNGLIGETNQLDVVIPGLSSVELDTVRQSILAFRTMAAGESIQLPTAVGSPLEIACIASNCFAIAGEINGAPVSHLFDQEALESLLMTAHPDWRCAPQHQALGLRALALSWSQATVA